MNTNDHSKAPPASRLKAKKPAVTPEMLEQSQKGERPKVSRAVTALREIQRFLDLRKGPVE